MLQLSGWTTPEIHENQYAYTVPADIAPSRNITGHAPFGFICCYPCPFVPAHRFYGSIIAEMKTRNGLFSHYTVTHMRCRIDSIVTHSLSSLDATTDINQVAGFMTRNNLGSVLATDSGKVVGLFTERDLLTRVVGAEKDPREIRLGDVCTRNLISIPHTSACQDAIRLMQANNCRRLLVYRQDSLHGLINISDVAQALAENRRFKNLTVNLVGGLTLTIVLAVIAMLIAILPDMLQIAEHAMQ